MTTSDKLLADLKMLHPKLIDLSLGRIERLLARLDDPHRKLPPVIHIAGTNGKGSTTAFLLSILEEAGLRVHAYTSPHLISFHERIVLAGPDRRSASIGEDALVDVLRRTQAVNDGGDITQFEITTAAAFLAFAETPADVLLLEVGLGGRLDATNVIADPALAVITPVSMDHGDKLGDTLEAIAYEKAGILKRSVPAVIANQEDVALKAIRATAQSVGAPMQVWGEDFEAYEQRGRMVVQNQDRLLDLPAPGLNGPHQIINAGTAVAAALTFTSGEVGERALENGVADVRWPGRMQRLASGPLPDLLKSGGELWLDGGHNPAAGTALAQTLADLEERSSKPLHLVVGMMGLKDATGFLSHFSGLARHAVTVPVPGANEASQSPDGLAEAARSIGLQAEASNGIEAALRRIEQTYPGPKRVLICGSLYLAGHVLGLQDGVVAQPN